LHIRHDEFVRLLCPLLLLGKVAEHFKSLLKEFGHKKVVLG
jgi:hypothetical protein